MMDSYRILENLVEICMMQNSNAIFRCDLEFDLETFSNVPHECGTPYQCLAQHSNSTYSEILETNFSAACGIPQCRCGKAFQYSVSTWNSALKFCLMRSNGTNFPLHAEFRSPDVEKRSNTPYQHGTPH